MILIDTNVILRSKQKSSPHYQEVTEKLISLVADGEELAICPQIIYEFYVVATRPTNKNGFGFNPATICHNIITLSCICFSYFCKLNTLKYDQ